MWSVPEAPLCGSKVETSARSATRSTPPARGWARAGSALSQAASSAHIVTTPIRFMSEVTLGGSADTVKRRVGGGVPAAVAFLTAVARQWRLHATIARCHGEAARPAGGAAGRHDL